MTVGGLAKKMNTTVRTLQYYDKEGLLSPSATSEGGRRLYSDKDVIRLHQLLSMKYLGFSLDDIKHRLVSLNTPAEVATALAGQAEAVREKIASLTEVLQALEALQKETLQMEAVDFKKYADIVVNLQLKNDFYGIIKYFDERTLDHLRSRFDWESGTAVMSAMTRLFDVAAELEASGAPPSSDDGQSLAKAWWDIVIEVTGGDMSLLPDMTKAALSDGNEKWAAKWAAAEPYISNALEVYFTRLGLNPLEGLDL
jgi:DNA-binding transcriptional MerR regulator